MPVPLSIVRLTNGPIAPTAEAYSDTVESSDPVYVTWMHRTTATPGFAAGILYIAAPASLSEIDTVPELK